LQEGLLNLTAAWFWPKVSNRKGALFAIEEAFWVSLVLSFFTFLFVLIDFLRVQEANFDSLGLVYSVLFAGVAFGIHRRSRIAAAAGFGLYVLLRAFVWPPTGLGSFVIATLIALALLHGVRGTFAYRKLPPLPVGMPSIEQSFKAVASDNQQATKHE
jgi:hypothetical protein